MKIYKPTGYRFIENEIVLITSDVRLDKRRHAVLVIGDHDLIFLGRYHHLRGNIVDRDGNVIFAGDMDAEERGEIEHGIYRVRIDPKEFHPYTYRSPFPGFSFGDQVETLDTLREKAELQKIQYAERGWSFKASGENMIGKLDHLWRGYDWDTLRDS